MCTCKYFEYLDITSWHRPAVTSQSWPTSDQISLAAAAPRQPPFLGHWDSGYLGSKVQGPRIREHKDRFQANGSTPVREGAKFKNSQIVVKKVKWTYFDVK